MGKVHYGPRRSRLLAVLLVSTVTASIATALVLTLSSGSASVPAVPTAQRPVGYQVLYQTDTDTAGQNLEQWQLLTVGRPFEAAGLTYDSRPGPGAEPVSGYVSSEQALYNVSSKGGQLVADKEPGVPSGDQDLITQMPAMLARGLAADTGTARRIAGHTCTIYRLSQPPAGAITPLGRAGNHSDVCLEPNGIILSEAWTYRSHLVYSVRAVEVRVGNVQVPIPAGASSGNSALAGVLTPDSAPKSFLAPPPTPPGFRPDGTYHFSVPSQQNQQTLEASSVVWTFVKGANIVTVEAGTEAGGALPWDGEHTVLKPVSLPGFTDAQSAIRSDGAEIRISIGHGDEWVRVRGTEPVSWLARYSRSLRLVR